MVVLEKLREWSFESTELAHCFFKDHPTFDSHWICLPKGYVERVPHPMIVEVSQLHLTATGVAKVDCSFALKFLRYREKAWENLS